MRQINWVVFGRKSYLCVMKPYRYIQLSSEAQLVLEASYKTDERHHFREKCNALLLSNKGYTVPQIAGILSKCRDTIHSWFDKWEQEGIAGLAIKPGRGVKAKLDSNDASLYELVKKK